MEDIRKLIVPATKEQLPVISEFVEDLMTSSGFDLQKMFEVQLAVEEACTNIVLYAYPEGDGSISIDARAGAGRLELAIADSGKPFDPTARIVSIPTAGVEQRQIGGLGIPLIKASVDELSYEFKDGKNILKLVKIKHNISAKLNDQ